MRRARGQGYTLIEIMVVIVVIAVLLALILPNMVRSRYQGQLSACEHNQRAMASALENYSAQFQRYPDTLGTLFDRGFVHHVRCPSDSSEYGYQVNEEGNSYTLLCVGLHHIGLPGVVSTGFPQYSAASGLSRNPF